MIRPASDIACQDFPVVRRGYDPVLVRAFLTELADEIATDRAERRGRTAGASDPEAAPGPGDGDDGPIDALTVLLSHAIDQQGRLDAREAQLERSIVIQERFHRARSASAEAIVAGAEATAAAIVRAAQVEASQVAHRRWDELGGAVIAILERAASEAEAIRDAARRSADEIRRQVVAELIGWSPEVSETLPRLVPDGSAPDGRRKASDLDEPSR